MSNVKEKARNHKAKQMAPADFAPNPQAKILSRVVMLTPDMARKFLSRNFDNRNVSKKQVATFASDIKAGLWQLNGEPIIVSDTGELNDGQHRCHAVILADMPIQTLLVEGASRPSRLTTDMGRMRTAGNFLSMEGVTDANNVARVAGILLQIERRGEIPTSKGGGHNFTKQEVLEYANAHIKELEWASHLTVSKPTQLYGGKTNLMACAILFAKKTNHVEVEQFIHTMIKGENLKATDPIYVARERLLAEKLAKTLTPHKAMEIIIRAWNQHRKGQRVRSAVVRGSWPKIEG